MKSICCVLAIACFSLSGLVGCAADAPTGDTSDVIAPPQTTVIRYTADDIKALPAGESLQVDLNDENTVYSITYDDESQLDRVLVSRGLDQYVLSQRMPASASTSKHIILGAHDSASELTNLVDPKQDVSCKCPCCILVGRILICCD